MGVYKRGENWYVDFTFHGERVREMIGPSRKGAEKVIAKRKAEIAENKFLDVKKEPNPVKFHEFAKEYLPISLANRKQSEKIKQRELSIMRTLDREFGEKNIATITNWNIEQWKKKRREKVKPGTVNRDLGVLKCMLKKAVEWKRLKENPARMVKLFKTQGRLRFLMPEEIQTLISNCSDHLKPIVTIAVHTGMRKTELLTLKRSQVNFTLGIITLTNTKNQEIRHVPMNSTVRDTLESIKGDSEYYFGSMIKRGEPLQRIDKAFGYALKRSKIEDFTFHDLRHCFASNLIMNGADLYDVSELLGHKNPQITKRYAHLSPNYKKQTVAILDRVMSLNPPQGKNEVRKVANL
jgi:integrase